MISRKGLFFAFHFFILSLLILSSTVRADMGPKPEALIYVTSNGLPISGEFEARMLSCYNYAPCTRDTGTAIVLGCSSDGVSRDFDPLVPDDTTNLETLFIKDFDKKCSWQTSDVDLLSEDGCNNSVCTFSYSLPKSFKFAVKLADDKRIQVSQEIENNNFYSTYAANIRPSGLLIKETTKFIPFSFIGNIADVTNDVVKTGLSRIFFAFMATLLIEGVFLKLMFRKLHLRPRFLFVLFFANLLTINIVWLGCFIFSPDIVIFMPSFSLVLCLEVVAVLIETLIYFLIYRKQITLSKIIVYTFLANLLSFMAGIVIDFFYHIHVDRYCSSDFLCQVYGLLINLFR